MCAVSRERKSKENRQSPLQAMWLPISTGLFCIVRIRSTKILCSDITSNCNVTGDVVLASFIVCALFLPRLVFLQKAQSDKKVSTLTDRNGDLQAEKEVERLFHSSP